MTFKYIDKIKELNNIIEIEEKETYEKSNRNIGRSCLKKRMLYFLLEHHMQVF